MGDLLLDVRDLRVDFPLARGALHAVDGASFDVRAGEALGLVGESGSGKTMALRSLIGLLPRAARLAGGAIVFEGNDLALAPAETLRELRGRSIAMIFQEPMTALNPVMRVGDQIGEGPLVRLGFSRRRARERALELMRMVGIPDPEQRAGAYAHELSGGMRQRVMIAIALSMDPKLILCDEPTTALDVTIQDLAVIAQTCQRVAVMYAGQVIETGPVDTVFREPRHPYTLSLLRSVPDIDDVRELLSSIPGAPPDLADPPPGCRFHPRCPFVKPDCVEGAFPLRSFGVGRATACIHPDLAAEDVLRQPVIAGG